MWIRTLTLMLFWLVLGLSWQGRAQEESQSGAQPWECPEVSRLPESEQKGFVLLSMIDHLGYDPGASPWIEVTRFDSWQGPSVGNTPCFSNVALYIEYSYIRPQEEGQWCRRSVRVHGAQYFDSETQLAMGVEDKSVTRLVGECVALTAEEDGELLSGLNQCAAWEPCVDMSENGWPQTRDPMNSCECRDDIQGLRWIDKQFPGFHAAAGADLYTQPTDIVVPEVMWPSPRATGAN